MPARTIAIGDIHGCGTALSTLLSLLEITDQDTVVLLGDIVDRGPDTKGVIEQLLRLKSHCHELIYIRGNHEEMMLDALDTGTLNSMWLFHGGQEVLDSYEVDTVQDIPEEHVDFIRSSLNYWENDSEIFVHANVQHGRPLDVQFRQFLRWERYKGNEPPHPSGKRVIVGHTVMPHGMPRVSPGWVAIDTGVYEGNPLTAFDTSNNLFYQADQLGNRFPSFPLSEESPKDL